MLKKAGSVVLASLRGSTYRSVRLASSLAAALLTAFLSILPESSSVVSYVRIIEILAHQNRMKSI
jgi:hypothetical protein